MNERLIIPHKPPHHRHRAWAAIALSVLVVAGIWGWQMRMTFAKYALDREDQALQATKETFTEAAAAARDAQQEGAAALSDLVRQTIAEEQAKQEVLEQVGAGMVDQLAPPVAAPEAAAEAGAVAGETSEVN
jgi:hypothetical protein